ncbi:larval cuticle protein 65Ag1 [Eupeodes corollae]|uniref:larval cuticle protein 65Ag1 n=1 Tax=Eupeodes corollae TaxID=290404 RepID=UPI0024903756|nr:larval cuticle protein 65Ag1 [Eupeodes corollae]
MWYLKYFVWVLVVTAFAESAELPEDDSDPSLTPSSYAFSFETQNGQVRDESIDVDPDSNPGSKEPEADLNVKGSYSFISADGYEYSTYYKAGKNGYQPYVTAHKIKTDTTEKPKLLKPADDKA